MLEYIFEPYNTPFLYAFYFMLGILSLEVLSLLAGLGISEVIDNLFDATDVGLEADVDGDVGLENSFLSKYIAWIKVKDVPMLILVIIFLAAFSMVGFLGQSILFRLFEIILPKWASITGAVFLGFPIYKWTARILGEKVFREETSALSEKTFIGQIAEINTGTARVGLPAEAKLKDHFGQLHYFMVEPEDENETFEQGSKVELIRKDENTFKAIKLKN
ncbi:MAG: YqiJ family protein [Balneolaceae bacterium]